MKKPESERSPGRRKLMPARERGLRYPMEFIASELGVDVVTLRRKCEDSGYKLNGTGLRFRDAYDALSLKSVSEDARRRKHVAEAEASEIDTLEKKGVFVTKESHRNIISDIAVRTRVAVERAEYIPAPARKRLLNELREIKPSAK